MELSIIFDYLKTQALTNDFFSGAALAGVILGVLHQARAYLSKAFRFVWNRLFVEFKIHSEDYLYRPISIWLKNNNFDRFSKRYRLRTSSDDYKTSLGPDYGTYFFRYNGKWLRVVSTNESGVSSTESNSRSQTRDFMTITYFGFNNRILNQIVEGALSELEDHEALCIPVYRGGGYGFIESTYLEKGGSRGIALKDDDLTKIENDLNVFLNRKKWYEDRGVPWRRGYLFYGPPGTGKSSLAKHLSSKFEMPLYALSERDYVSDLPSKFSEIPKKAIILLEDIDCVYSVNREKGEKADTEPLKPSLNAVLNALDGVCSKEGQVVIMTTNHPDTLDPALLRPGRVDYRLHLGYVTEEQARRIFNKFFPEHSSEGFVVQGEVTPAQLQGFLLTCQSGEEACKRTAELQ